MTEALPILVLSGSVVHVETPMFADPPWSSTPCLLEAGWTNPDRREDLQAIALHGTGGARHELPENAISQDLLGPSGDYSLELLWMTHLYGTVKSLSVDDLSMTRSRVLVTRRLVTLFHHSASDIVLPFAGRTTLPDSFGLPPETPVLPIYPRHRADAAGSRHAAIRFRDTCRDEIDLILARIFDGHPHAPLRVVMP